MTEDVLPGNKETLNTSVSAATQNLIRTQLLLLLLLMLLIV